MTNLKLGFKQALSFVVDIFVLMLFTSVLSAMINSFLLEKSYFVAYLIFIFFWLTYIPFCEFKYGQTIGMRVVKTKIFFRNNLIEKLDTISARQIARVSMVWGVIGWIMFTLGKQVRCTYKIVELPIIRELKEIKESSGYTMLVFYILILISTVFGYFIAKDIFMGL